MEERLAKFFDRLLFSTPESRAAVRFAYQDILFRMEMAKILELLKFDDGDN